MPESHDGAQVRATLDPDATRLLDALLTRIDSTGRTQVPTSVLMGAARLTQGSMSRARAELQQKGLLHVEPGYSQGGLRGPNVYRLDRSLLSPEFRASTEGESGQNEASVAPETAPPAQTLLPVPSGGRHAGPGRLRLMLSKWRGSF